MRYKVIGYRRTGQRFPKLSLEEVVEPAKTRSEADTLYNIMLEDESMGDHVWMIDMASGGILRDSKRPEVNRN